MDVINAQMGQHVWLANLDIILMVSLVLLVLKAAWSAKMEHFANHVPLHTTMVLGQIMVNA